MPFLILLNNVKIILKIVFLRNKIVSKNCFFKFKYMRFYLNIFEQFKNNKPNLAEINTVSNFGYFGGYS